MENKPTLKRQNFNVTPEEEAQLQGLQEALNAPSIKDAILRAARILLTLNQEVKEGKRIFTADSNGNQMRLLLPDMEIPQTQWKFLAPRSGKQKKQYYIKGHRVTAANIWYDMLANERDIAAIAENWDLPLEAVEEIVRYCEANSDLIGMEAEEDKRIILAAGIVVVPGNLPRVAA